jgi:hypothetical protein
MESRRIWFSARASRRSDELLWGELRERFVDSEVVRLLRVERWVGRLKGQYEREG